jgi:hypothetical protein
LDDWKELYGLKLSLTVLVVGDGISLLLILKSVVGGQARGVPQVEGVYFFYVFPAELVFGGVGGHCHIVFPHLNLFLI